MPDETPIDKIQRKLYRTKAARFNADERLRAEHRLAQFSLMFLSVYILALSVGPIFKIPVFENIKADFWSTVLSIALLGVAALEAGNDRLTKALRLHESALKIDELYRRILSGNLNQYTEDDVKKFNDEYSQILAECDYNHCRIDILYNNMLDSWQPEFARFLNFIGFCFAYIKHSGWYWAAILLPLLLIGYAYFIQPLQSL